LIIDCIRSSGDVERKKIEKIEIREMNLIAIAIEIVIVSMKLPVVQKIPIKLNINIKTIKNKDPFIEVAHFFTILPNIAIGREERNTKNRIIGFVKYTVNIVNNIK
jgi:hypothetical protein